MGHAPRSANSVAEWSRGEAGVGAPIGFGGGGAPGVSSKEDAALYACDGRAGAGRAEAAGFELGAES